MYDGLKNLEVPRSPRHPGARRFARVGIVGLAICAVLVGGAGIYIYQKVSGALDKTHRLLPTDAPLPDEPVNVLVVGSDRRDVISKKERRRSPELRGPAGQRSDTMILVHISANAERAVAMSLPRDLRVEIPGVSGYRKLNEAYARGGPKLTIRTVRRFTGLPIHHYVEINFSSFRSIVDAVGGVNICVTRGYDEPKSGLRIPGAGCYDMKGDLALAFVRVRYIGSGSDLDRIERQQQFIRALMKRVKSVRFLFNLPRVAQLADALSRGVVTSQDVDLGVVRNVAAKLSASQRKVDFRIVPGYPQYIGGISYVVPNEEQSHAVFAAMKQDAPLPPYGKTGQSLPKPEDVTVTVLNGTKRSGLATREAEKLRKRGYSVASVGDASRRYARTTITHEPGDELKAELLARRYPGARVRTTLREQSTVVLILGRDRLARASPSPG